MELARNMTVNRRRRSERSSLLRSSQDDPGCQREIHLSLRPPLSWHRRSWWDQDGGDSLYLSVNTFLVRLPNEVLEDPAHAIPGFEDGLEERCEFAAVGGRRDEVTQTRLHQNYLFTRQTAADRL